MDLRETYNRIAEDWFRDHEKDEWWKLGVKEFVNLLDYEQTVLDLGCGPGLMVRAFEDRGIKVVGIDFSSEMIRIARRENPQSEFHCMDIREVSRLERQFNGILAKASLLHLSKRETQTLIRTSYQLLLPGGCAYYAVKARHSGKPAEEVRRENDYGYPYERYFSYYTLDEFRGYIQRAGYRIMNTIAETDWIQIVAKR